MPRPMFGETQYIGKSDSEMQEGRGGGCSQPAPTQPLLTTEILPLADHREETIEGPSCSMSLLKLFPERDLQIYCGLSMLSVAVIAVPYRYS